MGLVRIPWLTWRKVFLWEGKDWRLEVMSKNTKAVPHPDKQTDIDPYNAATGGRLIRLFGRLPEKTTIHAGQGTFGANWMDQSAPLTVQVVDSPSRVFVLTLTSPHMALNAHDTPVPYTMDHTATITADMAQPDLISKVQTAARGTRQKKLNHLVFSCHGFPADISIWGKRNPKHIGDHNVVEIFSQLKGLVDVIWILSCAVAGSEGGNGFCKAIAKQAGCHVVAATMLIPKTKLSLTKGQIELVWGCTPVVFTPPQGGAAEGSTISFVDFPLRKQTFDLKHAAKS